MGTVCFELLHELNTRTSYWTDELKVSEAELIRLRRVVESDSEWGEVEHALIYCKSQKYSCQIETVAYVTSSDGLS